jgi:hypothetical protein
MDWAWAWASVPCNNRRVAVALNIVYCITYAIQHTIQTIQTMQTMQTWRPPYPSENLKTPRIKTYSTINPYAVEDPQQELNQASQQPSQQQMQQELKHSKRENNSDKIYERGLTPQVGMNPFLQGNYLQDLETQNEFLKPMNSSLTSSKSS